MNLIWRTIWIHIKSNWLKKRDGIVPMTSVGVVKMTTLPTDIDVLMHMNNGRYLSIADIGRWDLLVRTGVIEDMNKLGWYPVVNQASVQYRKSLNLWDRFEVHSRLLGTDDRAVVLGQRFVRNGEIYAELVLRARFLKKSGGVVSIEELRGEFGDIPDEVPAWVHEWSQESRLPSTRQPAPSTWAPLLDRVVKKRS